MTVIEKIFSRLWELLVGLFGGSGSTEEPTYTFTVSPTEVELEEGREIRLLVRSLRHVRGKRDEKVDFAIRDLGALPRWLSAEITHHPDGYDTITLKHTEDHE